MAQPNRSIEVRPGKRSLNVRVGRAVLRLRKYRGLTQKELADRCGLTQAAVSQIEKGKRLSSLDVLQEISTALGRPLNELVELALLEKAEDEIHLEEFEASLREDPPDHDVPWEQVKARLGL